MKKINKKVLLVIGIVIFGIALIWLNMSRSAFIELRNLTKQKLATAQSKVKAVQVEPLSDQKTKLDQQLSQTTAQLEVVKEALPQPVGSAAVTAALFDIAKTYNLEVTNVTLSGRTKASLDGVPCSVMPVAVKVEGEVFQIVNFVTKLNSSFASGVVKSVAITVPETGGKKPSADIQFTIYMR